MKARTFILSPRVPNGSLRNTASNCATTKTSLYAAKLNVYANIKAKAAERRSQRSVRAPTISHDTVGAVALDSDGNVAAATSTGGTLNKAPGRLGRLFFDWLRLLCRQLSAAASTTGWGEPIMKLVLAKWAADRVASGSLPEWVAEEAINYLKDRVNGHGGMILLDSQGRYGIAHNTPRMAWAVTTDQRYAAGIDPCAHPAEERTSCCDT